MPAAMETIATIRLSATTAAMMAAIGRSTADRRNLDARRDGADRPFDDDRRKADDRRLSDDGPNALDRRDDGGARAARRRARSSA